jgi:ribosome maturation protein SDO1
MHLILFDNATVEAFGARCLDGSPSGYYVREGVEKDKFAFFLQGGGLCIEPVDCHERAKGNLGSSKNWGTTHVDSNNILSTESFNPFANWTHVFVPYGSGDVYIGTQKHRNEDGLFFAGHNTMEAIVSHLLNTTSLRSATHVLLSGGSAGGIGTFQNADWMGEALKDAGAPKGAVFRAAPQAGGFFVGADVVLFAELEEDLQENFADFASDYLYGWFGGVGDHLGGSAPYLDQR